MWSFRLATAKKAVRDHVGIRHIRIQITLKSITPTFISQGHEECPEFMVQTCPEKRAFDSDIFPIAGAL
jgi:hypothetical protein